MMKFILKTTFKTDAGKRLTISLPNIRQDVDTADIRAFVDKIIQHSDIFYGAQPVEFVGAEMVIVVTIDDV